MELDGREAGVIEEAPPLVLEEEEERLFDMLVRCVEDLKLNIVLRAAGGWVRDKLMKRRSDDIDIAIDKCTGVEFATNLNSWLRAQGLPTHAIGVVASNPDQSKHLETATCRLANHQVDFVHLRTETYSEHSRIPENVGFGTPEEDAQRRDFTLNALFYNLHTKKVENFTKTGLEDLRRRVLRTPLENAKETLLDDPLRVLRGVRLAALLRLQLHDEVVKGAQTRAVREGLRKKVSRERLGIELKKMLSGSAAAGEDARDARDTERGEAAQASGDRTQAGDGPTSPKKRRKDEAAQQDAEGEEGAEGGEDAEGEEDAEEEEDGDGEQGDGKTGAADQAEATRVRAENLRKEVVHNIARATAAATQGFLLLAELRVVESVFSLPDRVLVPQEGLSATAGKGEGARLAQGASAPGMQGEGDNRAGKHAAKKAEQNGKQAGKDVILSSEDDLLKGWWKDGLRCMHALNSLVTAAASSPSSEEAEIMRDLLRTPTRAEAPTEPEKAHSNGKANEGDAETDKKDAARSSDWRDSVRALNLAAFLFPLATRECLNEKKKPEDLLFHMVVTGLKLSKKDGSRALDLNKGARAFLRFLNEQSDAQQRSLYASAPHGAEAKEESQRAERIQLGLLLREAGGDIWPQALLLAAAIDQTRKTPSVSSLVASRDKDERRTEEEEAKEVAEATERAKLPVSADALKTFAELKKKIVALGLADAHRQPPLCDGHRVKTLLKNLPKGPLFKEILDEQIKWQLGHPAGTAAEYEEYLTGKYSAYV
ncbi:hypothetical protein NCLIV_058470 [Neospora caninum Liverpool]|uniref:CCA tRNA nucleotidyltransferase n=1 Tax=Neospora caninum (strain Liverpool) TaxID=572307 RepID=F0VNX8_NEOCL|nr:hypothetical protein NCLIV_058470 [Neospora caninum Liverpool]CBZ55424.1 hypothetical protein NCLIV_058470 [Neospora caninum Liverpool]CEL70160.1 TPA: CCA tRNA nucleotidyltransferase [Neospora caninum Liverpool]|eukprot:XP_003885452.1 hypothetical protein NCLIV_058470 [Neospora caninum Liverpool]